MTSERTKAISDIEDTYFGGEALDEGLVQALGSVDRKVFSLISALLRKARDQAMDEAREVYESSSC